MTRSDAQEKCVLANPRQKNCWARWMLFAFGWLNVALGLIGIIIPGMPTTVFLIAAVWAFSKSSERFHAWLWNHPKFGPSLRNWHDHKVIPIRAKILASLMMTFSFVMIVVVADDMTLPLAMFFVMVPAAIYVNTRASVAPSL